jgi:hypothetical protein
MKLTGVENMLYSIMSNQPDLSNRQVQVQLVRKLMEKPSELKEICDAATLDLMTIPGDLSVRSWTRQQKQQTGHEVTVRSTGHTLPYRCSCRLRRNVLRKSAQWKQLSVFHEVKSETMHYPGCRLSQVAQPVRQRKVGLVYSGLGHLLSMAVTTEFSMNYGAGGYSIAPSFRIQNTVDERRSPAFRVIMTIMYALNTFHFRERDKILLSAEEIIFQGVSNLRAIYNRRAASPTDIDISGRSLIHFLSFQQARLVSKPLHESKQHPKSIASCVA